ncbi:MAG TPA: PLP-dependent aminotransferase family protein [Gemmatimonadaceae bacterium]
MTKRATTLPLALPPRPAGTPAHRWLYGALRAEILEGRLRPGARLPATRDLAAQYALSRGTIVSAFQQLAAEGYIEGSVGSGTYVNRVLPDELLHAPRPARARPAPRRRERRPLSAFASRARLFPGYEARPTRAFRANLPALDLFPTTLWAQLAARRARRATTRLLMGCAPLGHEPLRESVADYLATSRGVACTPEQVAIVSGVQEALDLAARLLLDPGDRVCMEDPGYPGAALAFEACGASVVTAPLGDASAPLDASRLRGARLAYVTPAHQFPLGQAMSLPRRLELLEWARSSDAMIFEDDYDSEYRYTGRPLPALQGLDRRGVVLFGGSFSKVLFPSLRLGYLVVPPDLVDRVAAIKSLTSRHAPLLEQAVLHDFIAEGHFARHVRRMREVYAARLAVLLACARRRLAGLLEIADVEAGLQTAGWLAAGLDERAATKAAAERNVDVTPLGEYRRARAARDGLQLGFAAVDEREIRRGVRDLAAALETVARRREAR